MTLRSSKNSIINTEFKDTTNNINDLLNKKTPDSSVDSNRYDNFNKIS